MHTSELLMPAGSLLKMKTAILYGADAVYAGTPDMSLRTKSEFSLEELKEGIRYAHSLGKKVYLTLNLFSHDRDLAKLPLFIDTVRSLKPDGLIIADPGIFSFVKEHAPELELHISTQANVCSSLTVDFWKKQGASLVVLAREVSFEELTAIREKCPDIKLEAFVHGAMCMTYSGRCLLSNYLAERGANQGNCAQSCRWNYHVRMKLKDGTIKEIPLNDETKDMFEFLLEEEFRPGDFMPIEEDERGSYILNAKDLCLMPKLSDYLKLGINSLKVEGRNKTNYYAAIVARSYRRAIDDYYENPEEWDYQTYMEELQTLQSRGYSLAFHEGRLTNLAHNYDSAKSIAEYEYSGYIREWQGDDMIFEVKNTISGGELVQFISPYLASPIRVRLQDFEDSVTAVRTEKVSPGQNKAIRIPASLFQELGEVSDVKEMLPVCTVARKKKQLTPEEKARFLLDIEAQKSEIEGKPMDPEKKKDLLAQVEKQKEFLEKRKVAGKGPKMGSEGCCGKGCNGCMIFWNDPKYEAAREEMKKKKQGEKLAAHALRKVG